MFKYLAHLNSLPFVARWITLFAVIALSSCGGGSSNNAEPPPDDQSFAPLSDINGAQFVATRLTIVEGDSTSLSWTVPNASSVKLLPDNTILAESGELLVTPTETTEYVLLATVTGREGSFGQRITVTVNAVAAVMLQSNISSGFSPLTVRFTPVVSSTTNISRYFWDFEGDGGPNDGGLGVGAQGFDNLGIRTGGFTLDEFDTIGRSLNYTYDNPGTYTARIRVWDDGGNQAEATSIIVVENEAPKINDLYISSRFSAGEVPFSVTFELVAYDAEEIQSIEWDTNGDGVFDQTSEPRLVRGEFVSELRMVYETAGSFTPSVRITDTLGLATIGSAPSIRVEAASGPIPLISSPGNLSGDAPYAASIRFQVTDPGRTGIVSGDVDYDGDGTFDASVPVTTTGGLVVVDHTYEVPGNYYLTFLVTAADGTVGKRFVEVIVNANHSISISDNIMDPLAAETASVMLTLGGDSVSEIMVVNESGDPVRTLGDRRSRSTGEYTLEWDGKNATGQIVAPGLYYALLNFEVAGAEQTLDLRDTQTVKNYYPSISVDTQVLRAGIEPFNNQPVSYPITLNNYGINRVTAYVTQRGNDVLETSSSFFRARYFADGDYHIEWNGEGTTGKLLPVVDTRDAYVPGVIAESVADNAILLTHHAVISDQQADFPIYFPTRSVALVPSVISFNLSRPASIELTVASTNSGAEVFRKTFPNLAPGDTSVSWNGRDNAGNLLAPDGYRLQLVAVDAYGGTSLPAHVMQRIRY
ncbi:hypothetical protein [Granulosicoccus antarcticus]|uniref:PKD/Chitinase domain-containing protein n=1 Tax=Granulosicoccus antarcticus IMCC3135 TaxID=1192854 RepID=A0A2Z2NYA3_9GAMM|nr:hypothetical protein [Granulosicoccus antarcticus]ASJ76273.1 hypothetical protein IMCC3135_31120 [Granulosicoccus antarcticus IMCC3135]